MLFLKTEDYKRFDIIKLEEYINMRILHLLLFLTLGAAVFSYIGAK